MEKPDIRIYTTEDGKSEIRVSISQETIWLNQYQLEELFTTNRTSIIRHIANIYKTGELDKEATCAKIAQVRTEGTRTINRKINYYNLDLIIAVGYRVNSKRGTQFRIWANKILKEYLVKGFAVNQQRLTQEVKLLREFQDTAKIVGGISENKILSTNESAGLLQLISDYAYALDILDAYDYQRLKIEETTQREIYRLTYEEARAKIDFIKKLHGNSNLFGREKDQSFKSSLATIYQTFNGVDLYPSLEEKAANLLYLITKNHSFTDGNKRIAAFLFLYFLEKNGALFNIHRQKRIADNTLVALTLMIAVSKPEEKDIIVKVIVNLINKRNY